MPGGWKRFCSVATVTRRVRVRRTRSIDGDPNPLAVGLDGHLTIGDVATAVSDRCREQSQLVSQRGSALHRCHLEQVTERRDESTTHLG